MNGTLAERIQHRRNACGLTLTQLAQQAGVSKGYVSQLEHGEALSPSADVLYRLAFALNTTAADLLGRAPIADEEILLAEIERLRKENASMREIVEHVAHHGEFENWACIFSECEPVWNIKINDYEHAPDCRVTKARTILAK